MDSAVGDPQTGDSDAEGTAEVRAAVVGGSFVLYGAVFFDRLAPLYLSRTIANEFGVPQSLEGTLPLAIGFGWAISVFIANVLSGRLSNRRRIIFAAVGAAALDAASAVTGSWLWFVLLRGLAGILAGSSAQPVTAIVFAVSPSGRRGLDMGVVQSSTRVGGSLAAPAAVTAVAAVSGWRPALLLSAGVLFASALMIAWLLPADARPAASTSRRPRDDYQLHEGGRRNIAISTLGSIVLVAWLMIVSQGGVPLLVDWLGLGTARAGQVLAAFGVGAAVAAFVVPLSSDRLGRSRSLMLAAACGVGAGGAIAVLGRLGLGSIVLAVVLVTLAGVAMGGLPLVISLVPAEAVARGDVGRALTAPIVGAELVGGALLPLGAFALASVVGLPVVIGVAAGLLLLLGVSSAWLRPPVDAAIGKGAAQTSTGNPT